jgi:hypothetical protein
MCVAISQLGSLKYLNLNHSLCTDRGLLDLCGVTLDQESGRTHLSRSCKPHTRNVTPRWVRVEGRGALSLAHVDAIRLINLRWPQGSAFHPYEEVQQVPLDAGFVAMLIFLPKLKVLKTEVGGRAVQAYVRGRQSRRWLRPEPLGLEVLSEAYPTPAMMDCLAQYCPSLRELGW